MNEKNEEESKRQFTKLVLVMGYVLLGSMLIMLFETIRLWKKNRVNE